MEVKCHSNNIIRLEEDEAISTTGTQSSEEFESAGYMRKVQVKYISAGQNGHGQTLNGNAPYYSPNLPMELDIFDDVPDIVYHNRDVRDFLVAFKEEISRAYRASELEDLVLSKLMLSELTENEVVFDWIFNYFQMFFSFDKKEGNYWGTVMNNTEEGEFCNSVIKIRPEKRNDQIKTILSTAIMLIR